MKTAALSALLAVLGGCYGDCGGEWNDPPPTVQTPQNVPPPNVDSIALPDYPPIGPSTLVSATVSAPAGLSGVTMSFKNQVQLFASGSKATVTTTGAALGEGFGTLTVVARDLRFGTATRHRTGVLIDLTPPKVELGATELPAKGAFLEVWVADAFVVGRAELTAGGLTFEQKLEPGYPATVGKSWDYVLMQFPVEDLPIGTSTATLTSWDAAGNASEPHSFQLVIDPSPPKVAFVAPVSGATLSGAFDVTITASDPEGGPVWIDLFVGNTPVADLGQASTKIVLDAADFAAGPATLTAVARDRAGNVSLPAKADVTFATAVP